MTARRAGRVLALAAAVAACAFLALAGATRVALRSDWLPAQIDADPDALFVAWTEPRASLVPGRVRFATLLVRSRDPNVEWEARLEGVEVDVALSSLVARRFHAQRVRADALSFRLRERLAPEEITPARLARFPAIPGYADPPRLEPRRPAVLPGNPWRIAVDDLLVTRLREIWIDAWRWEGEGTVAGAFRLRPGIEAEVRPSVLTVAGGTLHWGRDSVSRRTHGEIRASLPRFDTQAYPGNDVWKIMSGSVSLEGSLDAIPFLAPDGEPPRLAAGTTGSVRVRAELAGGLGTAGVNADGTVLARIGGKTLSSRVRLEAVAPRIDFPGDLVSFSGSRAHVTEASFDGARPWNGVFEASEGRLVLDTGALDARIQARLGDARPLVVLLPAGPPRWVAGLFDLRDFSASGRLRARPGFLALSPARAEAGSFALDADYRRAGKNAWGALLVRKGALSLGVRLGSSTAVHLAGAAGWFEEEGRPGGLRTDHPRVEPPALRESR